MFNTNLKHLSNYLTKVLEHKKHFNIDDELQKYNIEKREAILRNILENINLKKKINDSLDVFNISSGSLFPELSDVAGYIKNRYGVR